MTHFASEGFAAVGGIDADEFAMIDVEAPEDYVYRVISQPSTLAPVTFTQYSTCFSHNIHKYVERGWKDEGFEAVYEKQCVDWINTKPDCSVQVVLANNPDLARALKEAKPQPRLAQLMRDRENDMRRGKYE